MKITYDCKLEANDVVISGDDPTDILHISFQRTIRVSDTEKISQLPPTLDHFPLYKISDYASKLPAEMVAKGGVFMPIYCGELGAGKFIQDYVVVPDPLWLDGIATQDGEVRQFVAMPYGEGYSVKAQTTGEESVGGIQFEVTPAIRQPKPALVFRPGPPIKDESQADMHIPARTLTGRDFRLFVDKEDTIANIKGWVQEKEKYPHNEQRLIYAGIQLEDDRTIADYNIASGQTLHLVLRLRGGGGSHWRMAVAAGGKIAQVINRDESTASIWRDQSPIVFNVQLLNAVFFKTVTGQEPPPTPISAETYKQYGFPFYAMYEEPTAIYGAFSSIQSVAQLEGEVEQHVSFPLKDIGSSKGEENKEKSDSLINPQGTATPIFRHITELVDSIKAISLVPEKKDLAQGA